MRSSVWIKSDCIGDMGSGGIDIKVGPAAKASVSYTVRDAGNVLCSDVRTYIYAAGELNPDTVVGKFLKTVWHYTLSKGFSV